MGQCEHCKHAEASFHQLDIKRDGEKVERHLCEKCARALGFLKDGPPAQGAANIEAFMLAGKVTAAALGSLVCEQCGISYLEFRNQGQLGCAHDYEAFREALHPLIERAQDGAGHHTGKTPASRGGGPRTTEQDLQRLRKQLDEAIAAEDYERAARLRDRIRRQEMS